MDDLFHREYSSVALRSEYVAEMVHDAVQQAREAVGRGADTTAKALDAAERGLEETASRFLAWAARHGVDVDGAREARMTLRFDNTPVDDVCDAVQHGFSVWKVAGLPPRQYREARVDLGDGFGDAWQFLQPKRSLPPRLDRPVAVGSGDARYSLS